jgi:hypothetical protein
MPRAKTKTTTEATTTTKTKTTAKPYRHTRTNAIRMSSGPLGYPYVPADEAVADPPGDKAEEA